MNCDEAFDALTDLNELSGFALEVHLANCPRCRQMKNLLGPAIELLSSQSPGTTEYNFWSQPTSTAGIHSLDKESVALAELTAKTLLERAVAPPARTLRTRYLWHAISVVALGVVCLIPLTLPSAAIPPSRLNEECTWQTPDSRSGKSADALGGTHQRSDQVVLTCVACHFRASSFTP